MVKFLLMFLISTLSCIVTEARIVPIMLVNTFDNIIGNACSIDRSTGLYFFSELELLLGSKIEPIVLEGKRFSINELEKLYSFDFKDDDFIFIYVSSHGFRKPQDMTTFPRIVFPDNTNISSFEIFEKFRKCKHRSILMVTDACNNQITEVPEEDEEHITSRRQMTPLRRSLAAELTTKSNAKKLFEESCFDLLINSSPAEVTSLITEHGSLFTTNFFYSMATELANESYLNIYDIVNQTAQLTKKDTESYFTKRGDREKVNESDGPYISIDSLIQDCNKNINNKYIRKNFIIDVKILDASWWYKIYGNEYRLDLTMRCLNSVECSEIKSVTYYLPGSLHSQIESRPTAQSACTFNVSESTNITAIVTFKTGENVFLRTFVKLP